VYLPDALAGNASLVADRLACALQPQQLVQWEFWDYPLLPIQPIGTAEPEKPLLLVGLEKITPSVDFRCFA
jgi:hypothetical protein